MYNASGFRNAMLLSLFFIDARESATMCWNDIAMFLAKFLATFLPECDQGGP